MEENNNNPNENLEQNPTIQEQQDIDPISNVETKTSSFNVSSQEPPKKKGNTRTGLLIIAIILIIAIVGGLVYYFVFYTKPDRIYKRLIESSINSYTNALKDADYKTSKTSIKLNADVNTDNDYIDEDILDLINKTDIGIEIQTDNEDKRFVLNLESNYDKESLLNMQMYSDIDDEKTYIYLKDLLNKYIEVDMDDSEFYSSFSELLDSQKVSSDEKISLQKAMEIIKKEVTNTIKPEYCSSQKEDIEINGKTINATKNTMKINAKQLKDELTTVCDNLKNNEEFLNCFEDEEDVLDSLEDILDSLEDIEEDENSQIEINLYTTGLMNNVVKISMTVHSDDEENITMVFTKAEENKYDLEFLEDDKSLFTGKINMTEKNDNEGTIQLELNIEEFGKVVINIDYSQKYNEDIDEINVKNSVKSDKLTTSDEKTLLTNLQKSKLYELIESFSGSNLTGTTTKNSITNDDEDDDINEEETSIKDNEIISYDDEYKITFNIPDGYKSRYVSDNYKSLDKDDISVKISTTLGDKDKYYANLEKTIKTYEEEEKYKNVKLSDMENIEVEGRIFYSAVVSYEYVSGSYEVKYSTKYIWSEISDKYLVDLQIRGEEDMTSEELNQILNMKVEKNK